MASSTRISRRTFLKSGTTAASAFALSCLMPAEGIHSVFANDRSENSNVFFTRKIDGEGLRRLYALVNQGMTGNIAVKLHTGEPGGPNLIPVDIVKSLMHDIPGASIVECNVLYPGPRQTTEGHRATIARNGWTFCPVDILDAEGDTHLPVHGGKWIKELAVGKNLLSYDSMLVLTHFKGHTLGGFGGSLKNIAIGCASGKAGKEQLHRQGDTLWSGGTNFMERMAEGGKAITGHFGQRITYINVLRNMSVDCDCAGTRAAAPVAPDLGILASTDILAADQASVDLVYALPEAQKRDLVERIESRGGLRQLTYMKELGMGAGSYDLIEI